MSALRIIAATSIISLAIGFLAASIWAQTSSSPSDIVKVRLPLELPAIGNIDAVKNWRFGRIESVVQVGANSEDVGLRIRTESGNVLEIVGPRVLSELARASNWMSYEGKQRLTRPDYVERMVAFDVDENNRIIAMISMEPIDRDRRRLQRGLE